MSEDVSIIVSFTPEQRLKLAELSNLMKSARGDFSKGYDVFKWIWNDGQDILRELVDDDSVCTDLYYLVDDIFKDLQQHALDWVVGEFDGRSFRDTKWNYDKIDQLASDTVDQAMYNRLQYSLCHDRLDADKVLKALEGMVK